MQQDHLESGTAFQAQGPSSVRSLQETHTDRIHYLQSALAKLGARNRVEAVYTLGEVGLL